jgi:urea carboxylase
VFFGWCFSLCIFLPLLQCCRALLRWRSQDTLPPTPFPIPLLSFFLSFFLVHQAYIQRLQVNKQIALLSEVARGALSPEAAVADLETYAPEPPACPPTEVVLRSVPPSDTHPGAILRLAGDRYVFMEYGPMELHLGLRVRVQQLEDALAAAGIDGLIETSPGVRSVMIEYDQTRLPLAELLKVLEATDAALVNADDVSIPSRVVHLPMAFDDRWTREAIAKYTRSVRPEAPYLPSNIEYVAANNGLEGDTEAVRSTVFAASYMVLGLGDVYLGAPCAVPMDPRHRLVTSKYNPARTFTPEGAVGIGGVYMCIYPMESPGGYQLVGRTLPIWNAFTRAGPFEPGKPWFLRNFDQVRYYEVSEEELEVARADFCNGRLQLRIEHTSFTVAEYHASVGGISEEVAAMKARQRAAMATQMAIDVEQLARLAAAQAAGTAPSAEDDNDDVVSEGSHAVTAAVTGTVWEIKTEVGAVVKAGDVLLVLEAMKMEYAVLAPSAGAVKRIRVKLSDMVQQGAALVVVEAQ